MTSGDFWSVYVFTDGITVHTFNWETDKREKSWNNEDKCVKWVVWMRFFLSPFGPHFCAKACSLNHCNKADPSQSVDSSEMKLSSFYRAHQNWLSLQYIWVYMHHKLYTVPFWTFFLNKMQILSGFHVVLKWFSFKSKVIFLLFLSKRTDDSLLIS